MRRLPPWLDQRGGTTAIMAGAATMLLGFAGLATEGGAWYLAKRNAVTAVDMAALAGAAAVERGVDAVAIGRDTVARNGFSPAADTIIVVNNPPLSGAQAGNANAVEVLVRRAMPLTIARLFISNAPIVQSRAVAVVHADEEVCVLALGGGLELGGNSTLNVRRCAMASNATASNGISINGSSRVRVAQLVTTGACNNCAGGDVWTDDTRTQRPITVANRSMPIRDPFAGLQGWTPSPPAGCQTVDFSKNAATISPGQAICSSVTVGTNDTLTLNPGIYYFKNADLTVRGTIQGNGVTIVMTGDPDSVGTIQINAQAKGDLHGPTSPLISGHPESDGLLFYRDARATNNGSQKEVQLNGGAALRLNGGMYFPTSNLVMNGTSDIGSTCMSLVAYRLSFSGNSDTDLDVSGCSGFAPYPTIRTVRLVE
ncbi:pilus assembly protein TadG-related protein [Muricoccus aerilatus]|uniref:pilus assembly protein TadG-related protein n=1 Tax=Muricoccus aerilatus TaxID=452982 RepID=UPI000A07B6C0|nr:pilus assembly protein TadG-related protein [Roseomonas aerilata]